MKIPKSIMVYGCKLRVDTIKLDEEHDGFLIMEEGVIQLSKKLKAEGRNETFLHECLHAVFRRTGLNQGLDDAIEETICQAVAQWLNETFHLKPKMGTKRARLTAPKASARK